MEKMKEEDVLGKIKTTFEDSGYKYVSANVWDGKRVYVNLRHDKSFSYDLSQNFKISSHPKLPSTDFEIAKSLIPFLKEHKASLLGL